LMDKNTKPITPTTITSAKMPPRIINVFFIDSPPTNVKN
jgi:hypothetical protein